MDLLLRCLAVGAAGAAGALLRLFVSTLCGRLLSTGFPTGTLVVNLSGSLMLGWFLTTVSQGHAASETLRLAVAVGFVGSYTTFSTLAFESNWLLQDGSEIAAVANLLGSIVLGLIAVRVGIWLGGG